MRTKINKSKLQIFVEDAVLSALSLFKVIILSDFFVKRVKSPEDKRKEAVILANAPSLKKSIEEYKEFLQDKDLFAVNFFWKSEYFLELKPKHYIILSTNYWAEGKTDINDKGRKETFKKLVELTTWPMYLYVPTIAKKHKAWKELIARNPNIKVHYLNITPVEGFQWLNFWLYRHNLGMPRPHNVLIPSIKLAIEMQYEKVYLFGAEHSWLQSIYVAENNKVYLVQRHFYDKKAPKAEVMYKGTTNEERNLADVLTKFVYTFQSYYELEDYARKNGVKILNATKDSYIDAFDRINLHKTLRNKS